ncbi:MAG: formate dehydrogenase [Pyrobaculum arsenaticum]|uniref:Formate dehydrogenase protein fdhE n=2 Tax=Pyrobaculum arsenaticum TaxID=121277 RepID=A4WJG4_PYRAR|nr:hypothetical protein [Pyrobaculum arsenaticum]ABP50531.1 formate dehydrogenase protein fdhE [Pyrobaculum arsenaticum DSM 13514]MCY0890517.1 formate dehydrogenase [Pyrobaculum arsenaticum]NYR14541.1 formate dehydrogenase [Pyrobaculum arsenaticum]
MELDKTICGEDLECLEELKQLPTFLKKVDDHAKYLAIVRVSDELPLVKSIDIKKTREAAERVVPREFVDYLIRRALYLKYGGGVANNRCKVCGEPASLIILRRQDTGIFESLVAEARCICGSTWPTELWRCPNCDVRGRENFEVYLLDELRILKCKKCGYKFGETEQPQDPIRLQTIHVKLALLLRKI